VGFPLARADGELPSELSRFIDAQGAPLVFTPGTGVVEVDHFFGAARECCERLGRAGVFLSPRLPAQSRGARGRFYQLDYLDLALLLPRAALLVHHGGIGTTARAFEAGVPQIISPQSFDQPDNGDRVSRLGVGHMIARPLLTGERLAGAAEGLLGSADVQARRQAFSSPTRAQRALANSADELERQFLARGTSRDAA
jgi:UDP:flavonoid glycosyltransferase YjiC (YdhE family)